MKNAIYLDYEWFSGGAQLSDDQRNDYIYMLQDFRISQQFADIGSINDDGTFPADGTAALGDWIRLSRLVDPAQRIVLVLNYGKRRTNKKFGNAIFNKNLNNAVARLVTQFKPDGIHLDIEGFIVDDDNLLALLGTLKSKSLIRTELSISTPVSIWTDDYIKKIALIVDQVNPMIYDLMGWGSWVVDEKTYQEYFRNSIARYASLIAGDCELIPTLPAYELKTADDGTIYHDPSIESMKAAIAAIHESGATVDGAGIFWGSHFLGLTHNYPRFSLDQHEWLNYWMDARS